MNQVSRTRIFIIAFVTIVSLILVFPSARYLLALGGDPIEDAAKEKDRQEQLKDYKFAAINLGLDLQGGVNVIFMIDEIESIKSRTEEMVVRLNNQFTSENISATADSIDGTQQFRVQLHDKAEARRVFNILSNYSDLIEGEYSEAALGEKGAAVLSIARAERDDAVQQDLEGALKVIRERLDTFGLAQPIISMQGKDRIVVQMPGISDPDKLIDMLKRLAQLEFRLAHSNYGSSTDPMDGLLDEFGDLRPDAIVPLGHEILPYKFGELNQETGQVTYTEGLILVEKNVRLDGENLRAANVIRDQFDLDNPIKVSIQFNNEGSKIFRDITTESAEKAQRGENPRSLAIALDGVVRSAPRMQTIITGGSAVIEGGFSFQEAQDLSLLLKAGSLRAPLMVESKQAVGATLGTESIFAGVKALGLGALVVIFFMVLYYGTAGVISVFALVLNVLIILAALSLADATLTLSGIGGILLTIGMAVDANVLIYERMREELDSGRTLRQAISVGFDRAFAVILDSNLTTLTAALVLLQFTEGSVRGFALTMTFGLVANLFTGLTVTYTLCSLWFQWRNGLSLGKLRIFAKTKFDFIRTRVVTLPLAIAFLVGSLIYIGTPGLLSFGVDFEGGLLTEVRFEEATTEPKIRAMLGEAGLEGERVQSVAGTNDYLIRVKMLEVDDGRGGLRTSLPETEAALKQGLATAFGDGGTEIVKSTSFGAETGQGFRNMAGLVVVLAALAILVILWVRFELVFGAAAVFALLHDLTVTIVGVSLWGVDISLDVVAALMVMLGFSVNDSIVVFDRVRENLRRSTDMTFREVCNVSMNQSLSRTMITSGTAILAIVVMFFVGGEGLRPFAKVLLLGTVFGTLSSVFIATPAVYWWNEKRKGKAIEKLGKKKTVETGGKEREVKKSRGGGNLPKTRAV